MPLLSEDTRAEIQARLAAVAPRVIQVRRWLETPGRPLTWTELWGKLTAALSLPRTNGGRLVMAAGSIVVFLVLVLCARSVLPWYGAEREDKKGAVSYPHASLINPILAGLGAGFLIYAAIRQARTATEVAQTGNRQAEIAGRRHVTDTFGKAVEQLGSDKMAVRVGGIYTLERLAWEGTGPDLYWTVMETLTAFVRERARWQGSKTDGLFGPDAASQAAAPPLAPDTDIAAVLDIIRRRPEAGRRWEQYRGWRFDLHATDLRGANLAGMHLPGAGLSQAHLEGANCTGIHLEGASLMEAHLNGALLADAHLDEHTFLILAHLDDALLLEAHLERVRFFQTYLNGAKLIKAHLAGAIFAVAHLEGADFWEADVEGVEFGAAYGDALTRLPEGVARPAHWPPYKPPDLDEIIASFPQPNGE